jgi:methylated-DNA-[protein]-cysteine S-methyltransferase
MNYSEVSAPFGPIGVCWQDQRLARVLLAPELTDDRPLTRLKPPGWLCSELEAYFADPGYRPQCAVELTGTGFQRRVWTLIETIPPGIPRTYGAIARALGSSPRAIGNACRANPIPLRIPCHRVIAADGLGGFAGDRSGRLLAIKRWLLEHEAAVAPSPSSQGFSGQLGASR